jgi:hypothetical protein
MADVDPRELDRPAKQTSRVVRTRDEFKHSQNARGSIILWSAIDDGEQQRSARLELGNFLHIVG